MKSQIKVCNSDSWRYESGRRMNMLICQWSELKKLEPAHADKLGLARTSEDNSTRTSLCGQTRNNDWLLHNNHSFVYSYYTSFMNE